MIPTANSRGGERWADAHVGLQMLVAFTKSSADVSHLVTAGLKTTYIGTISHLCKRHDLSQYRVQSSIVCIQPARNQPRKLVQHSEPSDVDLERAYNAEVERCPTSCGVLVSHNSQDSVLEAILATSEIS